MKFWHILLAYVVSTFLFITGIVWFISNVAWPWLAAILRANGVGGV